MQTTVYQLSGANSPLTYYGYTREPNILEAWTVGATRKDGDRADARFLSEHGGDTSALSVTQLGTFDDEFDALLFRNDRRLADKQSITGPTVWPFGDRVAKEVPDKYASWTKEMKWRVAENALAAYQADAWTFPQIVALAERHGRDQVQQDLKTLSYEEFNRKYFA